MSYKKYYVFWPGRIQEFVLGGRPLSRPVPLEVGSPLNQLGDLRERCKLPQRGPGGAPTTILSILKCMFYSCHLSGVP